MDLANRPLLTLPEAADYLHLPVEAVRAMVGAHYLAPRDGLAYDRRPVTSSS